LDRAHRRSGSDPRSSALIRGHTFFQSGESQGERKGPRISADERGSRPESVTLRKISISQNEYPIKPPAWRVYSSIGSAPVDKPMRSGDG
jgi:hypothetical protein